MSDLEQATMERQVSVLCRMCDLEQATMERQVSELCRMCDLEQAPYTFSLVFLVSIFLHFQSLTKYNE